MNKPETILGRRVVAMDVGKDKKSCVKCVISEECYDGRKTPCNPHERADKRNVYFIDASPSEPKPPAPEEKLKGVPSETQVKFEDVFGEKETISKEEAVTFTQGVCKKLKHQMLEEFNTRPDAELLRELFSYLERLGYTTPIYKDTVDVLLAKLKSALGEQ